MDDEVRGVLWPPAEVETAPPSQRPLSYTIKISVDEPLATIRVEATLPLSAMPALGQGLAPDKLSARDRFRVLLPELLYEMYYLNKSPGI